MATATAAPPTMVPLASSPSSSSSFSSPAASIVCSGRGSDLVSPFRCGRRALIVRRGPLGPFRRLRRPMLSVLDESKGTEVSVNTEIKKSESDRLVDSMDFGELCNDFVCVSSPYVEATARQLARDILEQREGNRALGSFSATVKYKDPIRSFIGREKYKRSSWSSYAIENPSVTVQEMMMQSTSVLSIKWTIKGKPKNIVVSSIGGDLVLLVNSRFTLNQISGQVIEHEESWDLSSSSIIGQAYFWASRTLYSAIQAGNDTMDSAKKMTKRLSPEKENTEIFPDPLGDPTKFFQRDEGLQRDVYQIALFLAVIYFVVQFLKLTL